MKVNLNDSVSVILTDDGAATLNKYNAQWSTMPGSTATVYLAFDKYETQLWDLFNIFGSKLHMGANPPFHSNSIIIDGAGHAKRIYSDADAL